MEKEIAAKAALTEKDRARVLAAKQQVMEIIEAEQEERINDKLRRQKAFVEDAAKFLAELERKLPTIDKKCKK